MGGAGGVGGAGPAAAGKPSLGLGHGLGRPRDPAVRPSVSAADAASTAAALVANAAPQVSDSALTRRPLGAIGAIGGGAAGAGGVAQSQRALTPEKAAGDIHAEVGDWGSPVTGSPVKKTAQHTAGSPSKMSTSGEPVDEYDDDFDDDFEEEEVEEE